MARAKVGVVRGLKAADSWSARDVLGEVPLDAPEVRDVQAYLSGLVRGEPRGYRIVPLGIARGLTAGQALAVALARWLREVER